MTILYREVTQNSVLWGVFMILLVLFVSVLVVYGIIELSEKMTMSRENRCKIGNQVMMGLLFFALISNIVGLYTLISTLGVTTERVEALQMIENFDEEVKDRGYEVVERRGEIVVLDGGDWGDDLAYRC